MPLFCSWTPHVWPKNIFSSKYQYVIVKQTGIKWGQGQITWKETGLINTKLSKLTKWEMYGRQKNSYGSLVSGRVNTKLTIYHKCILTEFEDICTSGFRSREIVQLNDLCKERRHGKLKRQLEKGRLPLLMSRTSLCLVPNTRCHFARKKTKKRNYKTSTWKILADLGFDKH